MAKKTKTLADVQTVTTVNDDQLIPITDASGNVVKVSMANLRAALIGNLQFSSINLIDGSESVTIVGTTNYAYKSYSLGKVNEGDEFAISIGSIINEQGSPEQYRSVIFASNSNLSNDVIFTQQDKSGVYKITKASDNALLLIYPGISGQTQGNTVRFDKIMFTRGNMPCPTWAPSINDQKQNAIDGVKIGVVNIINNGELNLAGVSSYEVASVTTNKELVAGNTYTAIISGYVSESQKLTLYDGSTTRPQGLFANIEDRIYKLVFKYNPGGSNRNSLKIYNAPNSGATDNPCDVDWICVYEGDVNVPDTFVPSIYDYEQRI